MTDRVGTMVAMAEDGSRTSRRVTIDGNEAAASVAFRTNEVMAIYPITPSSPMGEHADAWANDGVTNVWGNIPQVVEMQSEAGAAGAVHGALQGGALTSTFTASQGLLLMIPNMYKIAGELLPAVFHVAARSVATHALSIFGDHSDVMAVRSTGWGMLASSSVQEAHDLALIAQAATLRSRVPFVHFFDGFRTSHEVNTVELLSDDDLLALLPTDILLAHRLRRLDPDRPVIRGTAQNPDVFFQAREAVNPFYERLHDLVQATMDEFTSRVGRSYRLFDYVGAPDATEVIVMMGSGVGAAAAAVEALVADGAPVGLVKVRLFRPFSPETLVAALPSTVRTIAVLDRTKEPGAIGEPLFQDVATAVFEQSGRGLTGWPEPPRVIGGRYGLSSKEFTPNMARAVFTEAASAEARPRFTVGINDDVTHLSLPVIETQSRRARLEAVFFGLGADGTVGANKNSVKIVGEHTDLNAQGYFVYDSRKSGSVTTSHLRFDPDPIDAPYLVTEADFVACHQFEFLEKMDVLSVARPGATVLLNSPYGADETWRHLPAEVQEVIIEKGLELYAVDGDGIAGEAGLGRRINTVLQTCFFALADVLPLDEAVELVKDAVNKTYAKFGDVVLRKNVEAIDRAVDALTLVPVPERVDSTIHVREPVPDTAPEFVQRVTAMMLAGKGDLLPVSAMPVDGTFPTGTTQYEKRSIADEIPIFDPDICIECAKCSLMCPHAAIRMKVFEPDAIGGAPATFKTRPFQSKELPGRVMTIQVAPDDCTGCGVCVDVCPAKSKEVVKHKAINMEPKLEHLEAERANWEFFTTIAAPDRSQFRVDTVKGSQLVDPLFEFSGACAGCGETPYLKLLTQLQGDRLLVANATGCSSIFGGNLPTTPWRADETGRGPAWANSLFEDNAEFGLGMRVALDQEIDEAARLLTELAHEIGADLATAILEADQRDDAGVAAQRNRIDELTTALATIDDPRARRLEAVAGTLVRKSVWIVGGDGWAYDIGFGGLDHALASGRDINVLVLDTEVYSNTGGQASKATPRAAVARFAAGGKRTPKKDLGQIAIAYGNVYVAHVAIGANSTQTVKALAEAEAHLGPSIVIAYSTCIAHGIDMETSMSHQKGLVDSGYWPLYRFDPKQRGDGAFRLDSRAPTIPFRDVAELEARYAMLARTNPRDAAVLMAEAQRDIDDRWELYQQFTDIVWTQPEELAE